MTNSIRPILLFSILLVLSACQRDSDVADVGLHLDSARSYLEQGQFNAAMIESRTALQFDQDNVDANLIIVEVYLELGYTKKALELLESIKSDSYEYYSLLLRCYLQRGKFASTVHLLRQESKSFEGHEAEMYRFGGEAWLGLQNLENSKAEFEKALEVDSSNTKAKLGTIRLKAMRGDLEAAELELSALLEDNPLEVDAMVLSAAVFIAEGRVDLAEAKLSEAVSALPNTDIITRQRANLLSVLIRLLARQGRSGEALIYQQMLATSYPNAQEFGSKITDVKNEIRSGNLKNALALIEEIEAFSPENEATGTLRGLIAFVQGDDSGAEEFFLQNVDVEIAPESTLQTFALNQFRLNQPHRVVQILRENAKITRDPDVLALFGVAAITSDFVSEGVKALRKAIDLAPERVRLSVLLAQHLNATDPKAALDVLKAAYGIVQDDLVLNLALLNQYFLMDLGQQAREFAEGETKKAKLGYAALLVGGHYYNHVKEYDRAKAYFTNAISAEPEKIQGFLGLAEVQSAQGDYAASEQTYLDLLKIDNKVIGAYQGILESYIARNKTSEGILALSALATETGLSAPLTIISAYYASLNQDDQAEFYISQANAVGDGDFYNKEMNANIYLGRAQASFRDQDLETARTEVFTALSYYPANITLLALLVEIEIAAESYGEARKVIEQLEFVHPESRILFKSKGYLALAENDREAAKTFLENAWGMQPGDRLGHALFITYSELGLGDMAEEFVKEWRNKIPNSTNAAVNQAEVFAAKGDTDAAVGVYEELLVTVPNSTTLLNNLAWLYLEKGQLKKATTTAERAFELAPSNGFVADTYGWILYKANRRAEAVKVLQRAVSLSEDPEIAEHLAEAKSASN